MMVYQGEMTTKICKFVKQENVIWLPVATTKEDQ